MSRLEIDTQEVLIPRQEAKTELTINDFTRATSEVARTIGNRQGSKVLVGGNEVWSLRILLQLEAMQSGAIETVLQRAQMPLTQYEPTRADKIWTALDNLAIVAGRGIARARDSLEQGEDEKPIQPLLLIPESLHSLTKSSECYQQIKQVVEAENTVKDEITGIRPLHDRLRMMHSAKLYFDRSEHATATSRVTGTNHWQWGVLSREAPSDEPTITISRSDVENFFDDSSTRADSFVGLRAILAPLEARFAETVTAMDSVRLVASRIMTESLANEFEESTRNISPDQIAQLVLAATLAYQSKQPLSNNDKLRSSLDLAADTTKHLNHLIFNNPHGMALWNQEFVFLDNLGQFPFKLQKHRGASGSSEIRLLGYFAGFEPQEGNLCRSTDILMATDGFSYSSLGGQLQAALEPVTNLQGYFEAHESESSKIYNLLGIKYHDRLGEMPELMDEVLRAEKLNILKNNLSDYTLCAWVQCLIDSSGTPLSAAAKSLESSSLALSVDQAKLQRLSEMITDIGDDIAFVKSPMAARAELWSLGIKSAEEFASLLGEIAVEITRYNPHTANKDQLEGYNRTLKSLVDSIYGTDIKPANIFNVLTFIDTEVARKIFRLPILVPGKAK